VGMARRYGWASAHAHAGTSGVLLTKFLSFAVSGTPQRLPGRHYEAKTIPGERGGDCPAPARRALLEPTPWVWQALDLGRPNHAHSEAIPSLRRCPSVLAGHSRPIRLRACLAPAAAPVEARWPQAHMVWA